MLLLRALQEPLDITSVEVSSGGAGASSALPGQGSRTESLLSPPWGTARGAEPSSRGHAWAVRGPAAACWALVALHRQERTHTPGRNLPF